jgi:hypothetical protein
MSYRKAYVGTEHSQSLVDRLSEFDCHLHVRILDKVINQANLVLVTKEEAALLNKQSVYIKQLELLVNKESDR